MRFLQCVQPFGYGVGEGAMPISTETAHAQRGVWRQAAAYWFRWTSLEPSHLVCAKAAGRCTQWHLRQLSIPIA
jgi:hypothetical protein